MTMDFIKVFFAALLSIAALFLIAKIVGCKDASKK